MSQGLGIGEITGVVAGTGVSLGAAANASFKATSNILIAGAPAGTGSVYAESDNGNVTVQGNLGNAGARLNGAFLKATNGDVQAGSIFTDGALGTIGLIGNNVTVGGAEQHRRRQTRSPLLVIR